MSEEAYPSNSERKKTPAKKAPPEKKVEKITTGGVKREKQSISKRLKETFTSEDADTVGQYVIFEVLVPAAKSAISDAVSQGIERMLFGDVRSRNSGPRTGYTNYGSISRSSGTPLRARDEGRAISTRDKATHNFDGIILENRREAEEVIDRLGDLIDNYDAATVSDLYELVGITGSFTDDKWGWTDIRSAGIRRVREGYLLQLPRTEPLR